MREVKRRELQENIKGMYVELPRTLYWKIDDYCHAQRMSKAFFITNLIEAFFEKDVDLVNREEVTDNE